MQVTFELSTLIQYCSFIIPGLLAIYCVFKLILWTPAIVKSIPTIVRLILELINIIAKQLCTEYSHLKYVLKRFIIINGLLVSVSLYSLSWNMKNVTYPRIGELPHPSILGIVLPLVVCLFITLFLLDIGKDKKRELEHEAEMLKTWNKR